MLSALKACERRNGLREWSFHSLLHFLLPFRGDVLLVAHDGVRSLLRKNLGNGLVRAVVRDAPRRPLPRRAPPRRGAAVLAAVVPADTRAGANGALLVVKELSAALDDVETVLGPEAPAITAGQKKRTGKPRKRSDKALAQIAPVVVQYGLNSISLSTDEVPTLYQTAQTLLPLQLRLQKMTKRVDDEVFNAQTESWEMGLQFYSLLQRRAKTNGDIAQSIAPLTKMFAYRHPSLDGGEEGEGGEAGGVVAEEHDCDRGEALRKGGSSEGPKASGGRRRSRALSARACR